MGFFGDIGNTIKGGIGGAIGNGITGGITGAITSGIGSLLGGLFGKKGPSQEELMQQQFEYQKQLMGLQAGYNRDQATYSQQLGKEMWDYTNYENQVKHLKEAGLNVGLMYGKGGAGGASAEGAGSAQGVGQPAAPNMMLGLQARQIEAQTKVMESEAAKNYADVAKTTAAEIPNTQQDTLLKEIQGAKTNAEIDKIGVDINRIIEETEKIFIENTYNSETLQDRIDYMHATVAEIDARIENTGADTELKKAMTEWYRKEVWAIPRKVAQGEMSVQAAIQQADAALMNAKTKIGELTEQNRHNMTTEDQKDQELLQKWVQIGAETIMGFLKTIAENLPQRRVKEVIHKLMGRVDKVEGDQGGK